MSGRQPEAKHLLLLDVDWAPDEAIEYVAGLLDDAAVKATWFVTHRSPAVDRLASHEGFELGLHPNFLPGSDHGATSAAVFRHCLGLVPGARSMRTHGLVQSTSLLTEAVTQGLRVDCSILLPGASCLCPVLQPTTAGSLVRVPTCFEDDVAMLDPRRDWSAASLLEPAGTRALAFHPIHVWRNHQRPDDYLALKRAVRDRSPLPPPRSGSGIGSLFRSIVASVAATGTHTTVLDHVVSSGLGAAFAR